MREHPVPQQISSYEFHLVGDMTLKQFFQLAGGAVVSLLIYASSLPGLIKWPLIIFFAFLGVSLAFLPIGERPLSSWIIAFIKAVYSPTKYTWRENAAENVFSQAYPQEPEAAQPGQEGNGAAHPKILSVFEEAESKFLNQVRQLFHTTPAAKEPPAEAAKVQAQPRAQIPRVEEVPETAPVHVVQEATQPQPQQPQPAPAPEQKAEKLSPVLTAAQRGGPGAQAVFAPEASPPSPPQRPNTVVGQVLTADGKIVEGAILEVRDANGLPVRAIKTNKVGHFMTVTPVQNGEYEIETEKEGLEFDVVRFRAEGQIIPPIQIRAKQVAESRSQAQAQAQPA